MMRKVGLHGALLAAIILLAGCTGTPEAAPRESGRAEFSGTRTEYITQIAACLQEAGINSKVGLDQFGAPVLETSVSPDAPGPPAEDLEAQLACTESLPLPPSPDTPEEIRHLFDNEVAVYECAVDAGFTPDLPPSFEVYLETVQSGAAQWMPLGDLDQDYVLARLACPGDPDRWF